MSGIDIGAFCRRHQRSSASQICEEVQRSADTASEKERKASALSALRFAASHLEKQRWGRVRTALLLALSLAPNSQSVWRQAVRLQILSVGSIDSPSRRRLWGLLNEERADILAALHARLPARLETLTALESIREQLCQHTLPYRTLLRKRPLGLLKSAMAFADHTFFDAQHRGEPDDLWLQSADVSVTIESKEELSECISSLDALGSHASAVRRLGTDSPTRGRNWW